MDPGSLLLGGFVGAVVVMFIFSNLTSTADYNKGYAKADEEGKAHHDRVVGAWRKKYEKEKAEQTTKNAELEGKITKLGGQVQDSTSKLKQLEASKVKEIAKAIESERAKLQTDFDLRKQALEPKIRGEVEAAFEEKLKEAMADHNKKQQQLLEIALGDEELVRLADIHKTFDTVWVLLQAKKDKTLLRDLRTAAQIDKEHFKNMVETKFQALTQGEGERAGEPLGSTDARILASLKTQRLKHGQISQSTGLPKATVSDALKRLERARLVDKDPETGEYFAVQDSGGSRGAA